MLATLRQPFDLLAETVAGAERAATEDGAKTAKSENWRPPRNRLSFCPLVGTCYSAPNLCSKGPNSALRRQRARQGP